MKKLLLLRHAKSSWQYHVEDYDRPLSEKGIKDINKVSLKNIDDLYSFNYKNIIDYVYKLDNALSNGVLVGHNPAFSNAAEYFSEKRPPELKTSDWIMLEFRQNNWSKVSKGIYTYESKKNWK